MTKNQPNEIRRYKDKNGNEPYTKWENKKLKKDIRGLAKINTRLDRLELGNYGDHEPVGEGVFELRIHHGPGYRVYFGEDGPNLILLLAGGDKDSQDSDIKKAKDYWRDHRNGK